MCNSLSIACEVQKTFVVSNKTYCEVDLTKINFLLLGFLLPLLARFLMICCVFLCINQWVKIIDIIPLRVLVFILILFILLYFSSRDTEYILQNLKITPTCKSIQCQSQLRMRFNWLWNLIWINGLISDIIK